MTNNDSIKIVQHADDYTNMLRDRKSMRKLLKIISDIQRVPDPNLSEKKRMLINKFFKKYMQMRNTDIYIWRKNCEKLHKI